MTILGLRRQRLTRGLVAANGLFLIRQRRSVPGLNEHPDAPNDKIGTSFHPAWPLVHPDTLFMTTGSDGSGLTVPSMNPSRFRPGPLELTSMPGRNPDWTHRGAATTLGHAGQVVNGVVGRLKVVGAGQNDQVTVGPLRIQIVARKSGNGDEDARPPVGQSEPAVKERRPHTKGDGEPGWFVSDGFAGVGWWNGGGPSIIQGKPLRPERLRPGSISQKGLERRPLLLRSGRRPPQRRTSALGVAIPDWCGP